MKDINSLKRVSLGVFPTPLQKLENISKDLGTNIWLKRDDMSGVALGGNKVRKLEFLLAEAKEQGAEIIFTTGQAQSNHAMLTAACALKLNMTPILVLKNKGVTDCKGNLFLEHLMGVDVRLMDAESYDEIYAEMDRIGQASGKKYYKIPCGGSNALGSVGYVDCVKEIKKQADDLGIKVNHLICAEGSGGTHAGIALGAKLFMEDTIVTGMMVDDSPFESITPEIARGTMKILDIDMNLNDDELNHIDCAGAGYAIPSIEGNEAIKYVAQKEGLFFDPVYTGKAFGGLLKMAREGKFKKDDNIVFIYTGGAGGLFALDSI